MSGLSMNLFEKFGIEPNNEDYYEMAFMHGSYATVHGIKYDYERLEFLVIKNIQNMERAN